MTGPFPEDIAILLEARDGDDAALGALMERLGRLLVCDRCLLFLRDPDSRLSRMTPEWARRPEFAFAREDRGWVVEAATLEENDPMFAAALRDPAALFIDDVLAADLALVNGPYEVENFGHRALIHAPLYHEDKIRRQDKDRTSTNSIRKEALIRTISVPATRCCGPYGAGNWYQPVQVVENWWWRNGLGVKLPYG